MKTIDREKKKSKDALISVTWLFLYLILIWLANITSALIGLPDSMNALSEVFFCILVFFWMKKRGQLSYYGIRSLKDLNYANLLFFTPMLFISFSNLMFGINIKYTWYQTLFIMIAMLGVGFSEEILFRGFLMKALMNKNVKTAILFPSLFFGILHLLNLLGGANLLLTILQCIYAFFFALMCSVFVYRTNNIIPCMICHSITNITDIFMPDNLTIQRQLLGCVVVIIPSAFYTLYLLRSKNEMRRN